MQMDEIVSQVNFMLGLPANKNVEGLETEKAVLIAFRELKRYIRTTTDKSVPFSTRIDLNAVGIVTKKVLGVRAAQPRIGLTMSNLDSGNIFQIAAAVNTYAPIGNTTVLNIDPIMSEMAMAQVRNTISTDFQWQYDKYNQVIYCTHRDPRPSLVTITYVPDFQDVSEIEGESWINYLIRMSTANMKVALGRARSKYTIEGSNVSLDGETLLNEGNDELAKMREELEAKQNRLVVIN